MRSLSAVMLVLTGLLAIGCETASPPAPTSAAAVPAESRVIPFTEASVESRDGAYEIRWVADAGPVAVYARNQPVTNTRGQRVGQGAASDRINVAGLAPEQRWYFELVPKRGAPLVIATRNLEMPNSPNFRDIGGYRTRDGRWVKMGVLYRSDQLNLLTDAEVQRMATLGIATVADLRTTEERAREPDRYPPGTEHVVLNVSADTESAQGLDQTFALIAEGRGGDLLLDGNRRFVSGASAQASYRGLLDRVTSNGGTAATLFHCTAGKDRTGWAAAVILTLLDVPRETVMADYLASNAALAAKNERYIGGLMQRYPGAARENFESIMGVQRDYLEAGFDEVEKRYGSFESYARQALGLDAAAIARLRALFLAGEPVFKSPSR